MLPKTRLNMVAEIEGKMITSRVYIVKPGENYEFRMPCGDLVHVNRYGNICYYYQALKPNRTISLMSRPSRFDCIGEQLRQYPRDVLYNLLPEVDKYLKDLRDRYRRHRQRQREAFRQENR